MDTMNSGKKIKYVEGVAELVTNTNKKLTNLLEEFKALTIKSKTASVDRCYNVVASLSNELIDGAKACANVAFTICETLANDRIRGEALVQAAKKALPVIEEAARNGERAGLIPDSVIDSRGLEEYFTSFEVSILKDLCITFIQIRKDLVVSLFDITQASSEEDMKELYVKVGRPLEELCNSIVSRYNQLTEALSALGIDISKEMSEIEQSTGKLNSIGTSATKVDLYGETQV